MVSLIRLTVRRARQQRLLQLAGSLSFTTLLAAVPFLAVSLALLTHFPLFKRFEVALEDHLLKGLLPEGLARTVLRYLSQFAANASGLTVWGSALLLVTAIALLLTVEDALNQIWQVKRRRPFLKRVGLYALMLIAGPPILGISLWAMSYLVGASMGLLDALPPWARFGVNLGPAALIWAGLSCLFYFVPNARVQRRDAILGGLVASVAIELGKHGFAAYLLKLPTYKAMYGTFAAFPLFLLWVYFSWLVTLSAALIPSTLGRGAAR
jgi:membrane protein